MQCVFNLFHFHFGVHGWLQASKIQIWFQKYINPSFSLVKRKEGCTIKRRNTSKMEKKVESGKKPSSSSSSFFFLGIFAIDARCSLSHNQGKGKGWGFPELYFQTIGKARACFQFRRGSNSLRNIFFSFQNFGDFLTLEEEERDSGLPKRRRKRRRRRRKAGLRAKESSKGQIPVFVGLKHCGTVQRGICLFQV